MERDFSVISELKSIREQKSRLSERESELSEPSFTDLSLIPLIYKLFNEIQEDTDFPSREGSVHQRKKFIFIILYLYSPSALAGGRVSSNIRGALSRAVSCYPSYISHNIENVLFQFQRYKEFRIDIEYLYTEIINRLKFKGLIK